MLRAYLTRRGLLAGAAGLLYSANAEAASFKRALGAGSSPVWLTLPSTPDLPRPLRQGLAQVNGTSIFFAQFGKGPNVLLLHGGLASSNYWGNQINELAKNFAVTVMDTRGHGRSPLTSDALSYELFEKDVIALLDFLEISRAAVVGWSDGAITGIRLASFHSDRITSLFAFGANVTLDGLKPGGAKSATFVSFASRCRREYVSLSPYPERWPKLTNELSRMWHSEPNFTKAQLSKIDKPVAVADGEYDEIIKREHTKQISTNIKGSSLLILPNVSHFAMLQNPAEFNVAVNKFLLNVG
jgi:pimeloyl-ACP methyl ester carboxylesterase